MGKKNVLKMEGVIKSFGATKALKGVDLEIQENEVHAIVGANGAGKSTLMKTLMGEYKPDGGKLFYYDEDITGYSPLAMQDLGIQIVHQVLNIVGSLSILENIMISNPAIKNGILDWETGKGLADEILEFIGIDFDLAQPASTLSVAEQQFVILARALISHPKILILDEPTSRISLEETEKLFEIINKLKETGTTTIYISHRMEEIYRICDRISIFRDGMRIDTRNTVDFTEDELVALMLGKKIDVFFPKAEVPITDEILKVENLVYGDKVKDISFSLKKGEIISILGAVGAGKTETCGCIYGVNRRTSGEIYIAGKKMPSVYSPKYAIKSGVALVPEDRALQGMIGERNVMENTSSISMHKVSRFSFIKNKKDKQVAQLSNNKLLVQPNDINYIMKGLSGGNQQKIVIGKWLLESYNIYLLDEVAAGVDVGAKAEIYKILGDLARGGAGVVLSTGDIEEALGLSDRLIILYKGQVIKELKPQDTTKEEVLKYIMGGGSGEK